MNGNDFLKRLRDNPLYQSALKSVDPEQAKRISEMTERFLSQAVDGLIPLINQAKDPAAPVINIEPETSGSKD